MGNPTATDTLTVDELKQKPFPFVGIYEITGVITMMWDVLNNGELIDIVCTDESMTSEEVKQSLVNHDGYEDSITVVPHVRPVYDVGYIREKATIIIRAANQIIDTTNKQQTTNVRSDYIGGILDIERALNGLHIKCREIMRVCKENESDYGLRHLGEIKFGE